MNTEAPTTMTIGGCTICGEGTIGGEGRTRNPPGHVTKMVSYEDWACSNAERVAKRYGLEPQRPGETLADFVRRLSVDLFRPLLPSDGNATPGTRFRDGTR